MTLAPPEPEEDAELRQLWNALLDVVERHGTGVLLTVDEVHRGAAAELRALAATYQHLVREERDVALVVAGLPSGVEGLLNDEVLTFLRRAERHTLADVPLPEVRTALRSTISESGRQIEDDALDLATEATGGYPFMIQLVGYHVWRKAEDDKIDLHAASGGVDAARVRLGNTVHEANLQALSDVDRTYLIAMAQDDGPSRTKAIAERLGVGIGYGNVYRARLIAAGVIAARGHGRVDFTVPYLREHLREHAAGEELGERLARE